MTTRLDEVKAMLVKHGIAEVDTGTGFLRAKSDANSAFVEELMEWSANGGTGGGSEVNNVKDNLKILINTNTNTNTNINSEKTSKQNTINSINLLDSGGESTGTGGETAAELSSSSAQRPSQLLLEGNAFQRIDPNILDGEEEF
jgi:hypothetical protein